MKYGAMLVALALGSGCANDTDTRPETAAYISAAIIVPYCGRAACHASASQSRGYQLDTLEGLRAGGLVVRGDSAGSLLVQVLEGGRKLMPPDTPLPDADVALIKKWIDDGADGL